MATLATYVSSRDVYRQFGEMLGVDLSKCRKAVIHLEADGPVLVDLIGVPAEKDNDTPDGYVDVTTFADNCRRFELAPCQSCNHADATPLRPCPYAEEVHNSSKECNCCDACRRECARDI